VRPDHLDQEGDDQQHAEEEKGNADHTFIKLDATEKKRSVAEWRSAGESHNPKNEDCYSKCKNKIRKRIHGVKSGKPNKMHS
jgi:hypothetical protein